MLLFIDSGMLIGNAFIASLESCKKRFISWEKICEYGNAIYTEYQKREEELKLLFTRYYTAIFFENYKDWFREINVNGERGIILLDEVSSEMLRNEFRILLSLETVKVLEKIEKNFVF